MTIRKSTLYFGYITAMLLVGCLMTIHALSARGTAGARLAEKRAMVRELGLTDLCLFTEARYTRHPSLADLHSPFQEGPLSLEHFPSGSLFAPPRVLRSGHHD